MEVVGFCLSGVKTWCKTITAIWAGVKPSLQFDWGQMIQAELSTDPGNCTVSHNCLRL